MKFTATILLTQAYGCLWSGSSFFSSLVFILTKCFQKSSASAVIPASCLCQVLTPTAVAEDSRLKSMTVKENEEALSYQKTKMAVEWK